MYSGAYSTGNYRKTIMLDQLKYARYVLNGSELCAEQTHVVHQYVVDINSGVLESDTVPVPVVSLQQLAFALVLLLCL